jgi:hypothetical protein
MAEQATLEAPSQVTPEAAPAPDVDTELSAVFDRLNVTNGADRGDSGKFTSPNPETPSEPAEVASPEADTQGQGEGAEPDPTLTGTAPLPPSWQHKPELWEKLPPESRQWAAEVERRHQQTLSEQGRTIATAKPLMEVVKAHEQLYAGRSMPDGRPVTPADAVNFLLAAQSRLDSGNPVPEILRIADSYGVRQQLAQHLGIQSNQPVDTQALLNKIGSLEQQLMQANPRNISQIISQQLSEQQAIDSNVRLFEDFAERNPVIREVPESDMLDFIALAKKKLPDTSSPRDVLAKAYDMAVNADPALRSKTAVPKAPVPDAKKAEEARRATSVNVRSTSTGKDRVPSLDEELGSIWDKNRKG